jgi:hypothetical protein
MCNCNRNAILLAIRSFVSRPFNWDNAEALTIRDDVLMMAEGLFGPDGPCLATLPMPDVDLDADGTVTVEFTVGGRTLDLTLLCRTTVGYLKEWDRGSASQAGFIDVSTAAGVKEIEAKLDWLREA